MGEPYTHTLDQHFQNWESYAFGFGYGTGEEHVLGALRQFMECVGKGGASSDRGYDYKYLENVLTPTVAWLMINILAKRNIIEYGVSPRYGWLTPQGEKLRDYVLAKTVDQLCQACWEDAENATYCAPDVCNCGPDGWDRNAKCKNPFWS